MAMILEIVGKKVEVSLRRFDIFQRNMALVAFSRLYNPLCWSVVLSVGRWPLAFLAYPAHSGVFCITAPAQMLELVFFITAPAHLHATSVAVYPALFQMKQNMTT